VSLSLKKFVEELAELAGVSPEALLKVAGTLSIASMLFSTEKRGKEELLLEALKVEPVAPLSEIQKATGLSAEELTRTISLLKEKGVVYTAEDPAWGTLVAINSDGTLSLSELDDRNRRRVIINWYANRGKKLSYRDVHSINRQILEQKGKLTTRDKVLEALRSGTKTRAQLIALGVNRETLDKVLRKLVREGLVERLDKGLYQLKTQH